MVWDGRRVMHVQRSVKSVRRKAKPTHSIERVKNVNVFSNCTEHEDMVFLKMATCFICFTRRCRFLSYSSLPMQTSWRCGCIYALSSLPFSCQVPIALFSLLPSQFLPFWCCDNETATAATALRMINLRNCTQLICKQDVLIAFLSGMDVCCAQAPPSIAFLKCDKLHS